ncbi:SWI/SNF-related matrix-associated actin-dependent regulator of chromatin subfamily A-like protein 1 [Holothuria leucospilota]|uniref:SWI/SNF-related matrix-associated actin-dependent regulator of chromatin subfamily A-like protein 1 n=1 Tax=Holothuria leucospilota TaxID=206669 RepID=A0A9Q0YS69_HOLLE|nr:SWI/SNF-related matrix-associated actin-dependent regulator of chromatin subfamily A-like protein 1 [Holothuria leucospilota]
MFPSFHDFGIRYCDAKQTPWGWDYSGSSNLTELQLLLERKIMIRRLKSDVLSQLPSKTRQKVIMDPKSIKMKSSSFKSLAAAARKETANREMILEYYAETARMKMPAVRTYVEDLLEGDKKFLVFAHHQHMMEALCEACHSKKVQFIRIDGSTPPQQRFKFCEDFQTKDECRVAILSIMAANSGITLTAASLVVFAELFWNPGILVQAEDRAHRIGQSDAVFIHYLIARGTADDHLWPLVQRKLRILEKAGLSKNDFSEADTKIMKDPTQQSILNFLEQSFAEELTPEELQALDAADVSSEGQTFDGKDDEQREEYGGGKVKESFRSEKDSCRTLDSLWSTTNKEIVTPPLKKLKAAPSR